MEPVVKADMHGQELWAAYWGHNGGLAFEHARILTPPGPDGVRLAGACGGLWRGYPYSIVWTLGLATDWTATWIRVAPDEPWSSDPDLSIRFDGERSWIGDDGREQPPWTRGGRFLAWEGSAFCHTPMLRHIGLDATDAAAVEVLVLNVFNGHAAGAPWTYTPLGDGRWRVDMEQTEHAEVTIAVDELGIVTDGVGAFVQRHRPGR